MRACLLIAVSAVAIVCLIGSSPTVAVGAPTDAFTTELQAVDWVNAYVRQPMGLPSITWSPTLAKAAANHSAYLALNHITELSLENHLEQTGNPGFSGVQPADRCQAVGAGTCDEDIGGGGPGAVAGWLLTPYHGSPFFSVCNIGLSGLSFSSKLQPWAVAEFQPCAFPTGTDAGAFNTAAGSLHIWPVSGLQHMPIRWAGSEIPDPLANYTGDPKDVGPPLFVVYTGTSAKSISITLTGPSGPVPLLTPGGTSSSTDPITQPVSQGSVIAVLVGHRLEPASNYKLRVVTDTGADVTSNFATDATHAAMATRPKVSLLSVPNTKIASSSRHLSVSKMPQSPGLPSGFRICTTIHGRLSKPA